MVIRAKKPPSTASQSVGRYAVVHIYMEWIFEKITKIDTLKSLQVELLIKMAHKYGESNKLYNESQSNNEGFDRSSQPGERFWQYNRHL
jgi:hypothetical protein